MDVAWQETFITKVTWIDEQHKRIIRSIKDFIDAADRGKEKSLIRNAMNLLNEFVSSHFEMEESYMQRYNYPRYAEHRQQHAKYELVIDNLKLEYDLNTDEVEFHKKIRTVLFRYWNDHIPGYDKPLAAFLSSRRELA